MPHRFALYISIILFCSTAMIALADNDWQQSDLAMAHFGDQLNGPEVDKKDMPNRLVWITMTADNTTSKNAIKTMAQLDRKYRRKGLIMIGMNVWRVSRSEQTDILRDAGAQFPFFNSGYIKYKGVARKGVTKHRDSVYLPYAVLYGPQGQIRWEGKFPPSYSKAARLVDKYVGLIKSPAQLEREKKLRELLEGEAVDEIKDVVKYIIRFQLGRAIKTCERAAKKSNDRGEQAKAMLDKLNDYAVKQLDEIMDNAYDEPSETLGELRSYSKTFAGSDYGKKAVAELYKLRKDKKFIETKRSEKQYLALSDDIKEIPFPEDYSNTTEEWENKFGKKFDKYKKQVDRFKDKYPQSAFCKKLETIITEYELTDDDEDKDAKCAKVVDKDQNVKSEEVADNDEVSWGDDEDQDD